MVTLLLPSATEFFRSYDSSIRVNSLVVPTTQVTHQEAFDMTIEKGDGFDMTTSWFIIPRYSAVHCQEEVISYMINIF